MTSPTPERSLADPVADTTAATEPTTVFGTPNPAPTAAAAAPPAVSIVDQVLDLDAILSSDVRRAEDIARIYGEPWREATITSLDEELQSLTDSNGSPLPGFEEDAYAVAVKLQTEQAAYAASAMTVRMRQMTADDFDAFLLRYKKSDQPGTPRPPEFWDELISLSAAEPAITVEQAKGLRAKLGRPAMAVLGNTAFEVNAQQGVSIPKSPRSSAVLRRASR